MNPYYKYRGSFPNFTLPRDEVEGIQAIYGNVKGKLVSMLVVYVNSRMLCHSSLIPFPVTIVKKSVIALYLSINK